MISVQNLTKEFRSAEEVKVAVNDITFEVEEGEFFTLLGPSGCGKTTTLRCIAGLEKPTSGTIRIGERDVYRDRVLVPTHRRALGMVFQSYAVWPHMSVFDNVAFPLTVAEDRPSKREIEQAVGEILTLVGLGDLPTRMATQLSGGQQQRLSLARALVRKPKVLLLDEPLSNLDAKLRERMRTELRLIQQRIGVTTLFVTHDQVEALSMSDRIAVMRDGAIEQLASSRSIYHSPESAFVAEFIGGANLLLGKVTGSTPGIGYEIETEIGFLVGSGSAGLQVGESVMAAIRLEDIQFIDPGEAPPDMSNCLPGRVGFTLFNGSSVDYHVNVGDGHIQARLGSRSQFERDHKVQLVIPFDHVRVLQIDDAFDSDGAPSLMERLSATKRAVEG